MTKFATLAAAMMVSFAALAPAHANTTAPAASTPAPKMSTPLARAPGICRPVRHCYRVGLKVVCTITRNC